MRIEAAIVHQKRGPFSIETIELEEPRPNEVLVRNVATGICHTDLVIRDQLIPLPLPALLGHEGSGVVERVGGQVRKVRAGDRVVMTFHSCGTCPSCAEGAPAYCVDLMSSNFSGKRPDGSPSVHLNGNPISANFFQQSSFATHSLVTERNVVKVDATLPDEILALLGPLGCGIQTGAGAVLNSLKPKAGSSVVVFGAGSVGISAMMAAHLAGCSTVIAVDLNPARLELAKQLGATDVVNAKETDAVDYIRSRTAGGADYSLETTASAKVLRQAVECLHARGICGSIGLPPAGTEVTLDMLSILFGRTLKGIIEGDSVPDTFINRLVTMFRQGRFPIDKLMTHYKFVDINVAVKATEDGHALKAILHMPR
jgi:aryl-alcohol dehydrogenase